jgi:hypothetical protein
MGVCQATFLPKFWVAVAEERWVEKYENLFNSLPNVGGISGVTYKAYSITASTHMTVSTRLPLPLNPPDKPS